jgi:cell division septum initiation protein DivIVA
MADKVARESPELVRKVAHGEITLPQAVREVAPPMRKPEPEPKDDQQARIDELSAALAEATADNESMARVFDANDQLAAAVAEAKRYREQARLLQERIDGLMREKAEAVRSAKSWKAKYEKLQRVTGTSV